MQTKAQEFYAEDRKIWRQWLNKNSGKTSSIWLIVYKKGSGIPSVTYVEAVEEALCFGWIDSKPNKRDEKSYLQFFARRNPKSNWSKINKERVAKLISQKRMTKKGMKMIELAKKNGTWNALDELSELILPGDLKEALSKNKLAQKYFEGFPASVKRGMLEWILNAKKEETRKKELTKQLGLLKRISERINIGSNLLNRSGDLQLS